MNTLNGEVAITTAKVDYSLTISVITKSRKVVDGKVGS